MHSYKKSFLVYVVLISTVAACPPLVADGPLCLAISYYQAERDSDVDLIEAEQYDEPSYRSASGMPA
jgi:hypothetical protein